MLPVRWGGWGSGGVGGWVGVLPAVPSGAVRGLSLPPPWCAVLVRLGWGGVWTAGTPVVAADGVGCRSRSLQGGQCGWACCPPAMPRVAIAPAWVVVRVRGPCILGRDPLVSGRGLGALPPCAAVAGFPALPFPPSRPAGALGCTPRVGPPPSWGGCVLGLGLCCGSAPAGGFPRLGLACGWASGSGSRSLRGGVSGRLRVWPPWGLRLGVGGRLAGVGRGRGAAVPGGRVLGFAPSHSAIGPCPSRALCAGSSCRRVASRRLHVCRVWRVAVRAGEECAHGVRVARPRWVVWQPA